MKKITSGKLQAIFAERDTDTILRYTNVRHFAIENGIPHILERNIILIDPAELIRTAGKDVTKCHDCVT